MTLIGSNGAGKTSTLKALADELEALELRWLELGEMIENAEAQA